MSERNRYDVSGVSLSLLLSLSPEPDMQPPGRALHALIPNTESDKYNGNAKSG